MFTGGSSRRRRVASTTVVLAAGRDPVCEPAWSSVRLGGRAVGGPVCHPASVHRTLGRADCGADRGADRRTDGPSRPPTRLLRRRPTRLLLRPPTRLRSLPPDPTAAPEAATVPYIVTFASGVDRADAGLHPGRRRRGRDATRSPSSGCVRSRPPTASVVAACAPIRCVCRVELDRVRDGRGRPDDTSLRRAVVAAEDRLGPGLRRGRRRAGTAVVAVLDTGVDALASRPRRSARRRDVVPRRLRRHVRPERPRHRHGRHHRGRDRQRRGHRRHRLRRRQGHARHRPRLPTASARTATSSRASCGPSITAPTSST